MSKLRLRALDRPCRMSLVLCAGGMVGLLALAMFVAGASASSGVVTEFTRGLSAGAQPHRITAGSDGNLWFVEGMATNKVARITPAGVVTELPGPLPAANGILSWGITAGPDGNLWFGGQYVPPRSCTPPPPPAPPFCTGPPISQVSVIGRMTPSGALTWFSAPQVPSAITTGPDGNLWFTLDSAIGRITPSGTVTLFRGGVNYPSSITAGPDGNVWFAQLDPGRVGRVTPAGVITLFRGLGPLQRGLGQAYSIAAGPDGNLWFTEPQGIGRITPSGTVTLFPFATKSNFYPNVITAGPDGDMWFTENFNFADECHIGRITPAGAITQFTRGISGGRVCQGIAAGPDGNIWFTEDLGNSSLGNGAVGRLIPPPNPNLVLPGVVLWPTSWVSGTQAALGTAANPPVSQLTVTAAAAPAALRAADAARAIPVGQVTVQARAGNTALIRLALTRRARSVLRTRGRLRVTITMIARLAGGGTRSTTRSVVLRPA